MAKSKLKSKPKSVKKKKEPPIIAQGRMRRVLQVITLLKNGHYTLAELGGRTDIKPRTMYRYIELVESVDFIVEKDFNNKYFIVTSENETVATQFTIEETKVMRTLIQSALSGNPMKGSIIKKLSLNSELDSLPRLFMKTREGKLIEQLSKAISNKKQVVLKNYHSANSGEIKDRLVEPFKFGDNYQTIFVLDTKDKVCKQFKIERIGEVVELDAAYKFQSLHSERQADIFGFTGDIETYVTLMLSLRAYLLLREEFPLSVNYLEKKDDGYQFHGPVSHFEGVGRFVLGLIDEITIVRPESFIFYVKDKINKRKLGS